MTKKQIEISLLIPFVLAGVAASFQANTAQAADTTNQAPETVQNSSQPTISQSGTWGTSAWTLDSNGQLTLQDGTLTDVLQGPWQNGGPINPNNIKTIVIAGHVRTGPSATDLFANLANLTSVTTSGNGQLDTSASTQANSMFMLNHSLQSVNINALDLSNASNISGIFYEDTALKNVSNLNQWKTDKATDMSLMFEKTAIANIDVSSWDTKNVVNMHQMFWNYQGNSINVGGTFGKNLGNVKDFGYMFCGMTYAAAVTGLNTWDTHAATDMSYFLNGSMNVMNIDVSNFNTSNVTDFAHMFDYTLQNFTLNLTSFDTRKATDMTGMLANLGLYQQGGQNFGLDTLGLGQNTILNSTVGLQDPIVGVTLPSNGKPVMEADWRNLTTNKTTATAAQLEDGQSHPAWYQWNTHVLMTLHMKDSAYVAGPKTKFNPADNFVSITDQDGHSVTVNNMKVTTDVNTDKPGDYNVTFSFTDEYGYPITDHATIHVAASKAFMNLKTDKVDLKWNEPFEPSQYFQNAANNAGQPVDFKDIQVSKTTDGYRYTFEDEYGNVIAKDLQVTVEPKPATPPIPVSPDNGKGNNGSKTPSNSNQPTNSPDNPKHGGSAEPNNDSGDKNHSGRSTAPNENQPTNTTDDQQHGSHGPSNNSQTSPTTGHDDQQSQHDDSKSDNNQNQNSNKQSSSTDQPASHSDDDQQKATTSTDNQSTNAANHDQNDNSEAAVQNQQTVKTTDDNTDKKQGSQPSSQTKLIVQPTNPIDSNNQNGIPSQQNIAATLGQRKSDSKQLQSGNLPLTNQV